MQPPVGANFIERRSVNTWSLKSAFGYDNGIDHPNS